jgi:hypothetical protein
MKQIVATEVSAIPEKNNNSMRIFVLLFALTTIFTACHPTKKIGNVIKPKAADTSMVNKDFEDSVRLLRNTFDQFKSKRIAYQTFSSKIKIESSGANGKNPDLLAVVRMVKDSAIWISISATILNVEVYRVMITKDSVILLNKQEKQVQYRSMDYLQEITQVPFDFSTLQDFIVGNPVFISDSIIACRKIEDKLLLATVDEHFKNLFTIFSADMKMTHSKMDDINAQRNRTADITYDEYESIQGVLFSSSREIAVSEKNRMDIILKFKQTEFNKELSMPFTIPKSYQRK